MYYMFIGKAYENHKKKVKILGDSNFLRPIREKVCNRSLPSPDGYGYSSVTPIHP